MKRFAAISLAFLLLTLQSMGQVVNYQQCINNENGISLQASGAENQDWLSFLLNHPNIGLSDGYVALIGVDEDIPRGWRLLTYFQAVQYQDLLKIILDPTSIVGLLDGTISNTENGAQLARAYGDEAGQLFVQGDISLDFFQNHQGVTLSCGTRAAKIGKNEPFPFNAKLVDTQTAQREKSRLNQLIGTWDILGLLNGKIDGTGYGNVIKVSYSVPSEFFIIKKLDLP